MSLTVVKDALEYYDTCEEKYESIKKNMHYISLKDIREDKKSLPVFNFYDDDKKLLFSSRTEILGMFFKQHDMWVWGWAIPGLPYATTATIRNVLLYGTTLDGDDNNLLVVKTELITSRLRLTDPIQIELHLALASYLAKKHMIIRIDNFPVLDEPDKLEKINNLDDKNGTSMYLYILDPPKLN